MIAKSLRVKVNNKTLVENFSLNLEKGLVAICSDSGVGMIALVACLAGLNGFFGINREETVITDCSLEIFLNVAKSKESF